MTTRMAAVALLAVLVLAPATAQESSNRVAEATDWAVFVEDDPQECWGVSKPKQMVNTRDGRVVPVRRGDTLLFVSFRPGSDNNGEIAFTGGYPFRPGSTVKLQIGSDSYDLFTEGEWAWPPGHSEDTEIVDAMKRGVEAVLTGMSSRGTQTKDTFSLIGFTEAMEEAAARCTS
jgi:Invasion associated locus B (IalB) protein